MSLRRTPARPATQYTGDGRPTPRTADPVTAHIGNDRPAKPRNYTHCALLDTSQSARLVVPLPKFAYIRSLALIKACREIPCQHCGTSDGTVCAAHSNESAHGKGRGIKASDVFVAAMCHRCHHELDQGAFMSQAGKVAMWRAAWRKTVNQLVNNGLWPAGIEVPTAIQHNETAP